MNNVMDNAHYRSLGLLFGGLLLLSLVVILGTHYTLAQLRQQTLVNAQRAGSSQVRMLENLLTESIQVIELTLQTPQEWPELQQAQPSAATDLSPALNARLERSIRKLPSLRSLSLARPDGRIVASSNPANVGQRVDPARLSTSPVQPVSGSGRLLLGGPWQGRDFDRAWPVSAQHPADADAPGLIPALRPIRSGNTQWLAIAAINPEFLLNQISHQLQGQAQAADARTADDGADSVCEVVRYDGQRLFSTQPTAQPGSLYPQPELTRRIAREEFGMVHASLEADPLQVFRASRRYPFYVVLGQDQTRLLAHWQEEAQSLWHSVTLSLLALLACSGILAYRLHLQIRAEAAHLRELQLAAHVFASTSDGIIITGADSRILSTNPAFTRITGYSPAQIRGRNPSCLSSGQHDPAFYQAMWESLRTQGSWTGEIINRTAGGSLLTEWLSIHAVHNAQGQVSHYVGVFSDLTEQRQTEARLRQLWQAVEQSISSIIITGTDGRIEYANPAFLRNTGYTLAEVLGQNPRLLQSGQTPVATYTAMWRALSGGRAWQGEFTNRRKDGSTYIEQAHIAPVRTPDGQVSHYVAVKHDITERAQMEEALRQARDAALAAGEAKASFLATMSHEIRTPMNGVLGMLDVVLNDPEMPPEEQRELLHYAHASAHNLLTVLNDILDFSKIAAGKLRLEIIPFSLPELLDDIAHLLGQTARDKALHLDIPPPALSNHHLKGDPTRLRQVLINLIGNAIKFTSQGGIRVEVAETQCLPEITWLTFTVEDSGIGIPAEKVDSIFDAFTQADGTITRRFGGTGLGLSICKHLVEMMGGHILAENTGHGSRFSFSIPLEPVRLPEIPAQS